MAISLYTAILYLDTFCYVFLQAVTVPSLLYGSAVFEMNAAGSISSIACQYEINSINTRVASLSVTGGQSSVSYHFYFCEDPSTSACLTSSKAELNQTALRMRNVTLQDMNNFVCYVDHQDGPGTAKTSLLYFKLDIYDASVTTSPSPVAAGQPVNITCSVQHRQDSKPSLRIRSPGIRGQGSTWSDYLRGQTLHNAVYSKVTYTLERVEDSKEIQCLIDTSAGKTLAVRRAISMFYGPGGQPSISTSSYTYMQDDLVTLTCNINQLEHGNPKVYAYHWFKNGESVNSSSNAQLNKLTFRMTSTLAGNYTCAVGNSYGTTNKSQEIDIQYKSLTTPGSAASSKASSNTAAVAGAVAGACILILIIVLVMVALICVRKRRREDSEQPEAAAADAEQNDPAAVGSLGQEGHAAADDNRDYEVSDNIIYADLDSPAIRAQPIAEEPVNPTPKEDLYASIDRTKKKPKEPPNEAPEEEADSFVDPINAALESRDQTYMY